MSAVSHRHLPFQSSGPVTRFPCLGCRGNLGNLGNLGGTGDSLICVCFCEFCRPSATTLSEAQIMPRRQRCVLGRKGTDALYFGSLDSLKEAALTGTFLWRLRHPPGPAAFENPQSNDAISGLLTPRRRCGTGSRCACRSWSPRRNAYRKFSTSIKSVVSGSSLLYSSHRPSGETERPAARSDSTLRTVAAFRVAKS
jgi:hypothetical protein